MLCADSKCSDQIAQTCSLIWAFALCICIEDYFCDSQVNFSTEGVQTDLSNCCLHIEYIYMYTFSTLQFILTLLHSERPKLYAILAFLSAIGLS